MVGTVTIVYDHHTRDLGEKLTEHQHAHHDAHFCLEVIVVKGTAGEVKRIADELIGTRGVIHGKLVGTITGHQLR